MIVPYRMLPVQSLIKFCVIIFYIIFRACFNTQSTLLATPLL